MKLAHLSDLHYSTERREEIRWILDHVRYSGAEHLIITGDLTDAGSDVQMRGLFTLLESAGYGDTESLTVIPGNHDLYGFIYQTFDNPHGVLGNVRGVRSLVTATRKILEFRKRLLAYSSADYDSSLANFSRYYGSAFDGVIRMSGQSNFPFIKLLPGDLALIGIDSNFCLPRTYGLANTLYYARHAIRSHDITLLGENLSGSTGWIDIPSLETALSHPAVRHRKKIVLLHHCLYDFAHLALHTSLPYAMEMRLTNRDDVARILTAHAVDLVLHGHEHTTESYHVIGGVRVLNGGGAFSGRFHVIDSIGPMIRVHRRDSVGGESHSSCDHETARP